MFFDFGTRDTFISNGEIIITGVETDEALKTDTAAKVTKTLAAVKFIWSLH